MDIIKTFSFLGEHAKRYGVDEAIMLQNIIYWISKNKSNNVNYHDGKYWTYNSASSFRELFYFWSEWQIRRIIDNLVGHGVLVVGNYNKSSYDNTKWYSLSDWSYREFIIGDCEMNKDRNIATPELKNNDADIAEPLSGHSKTARPIPDINTDIKPDINTDTHTGVPPVPEPDNTNELAKKLWNIYPMKKGVAVARKKIPKLIKQYGYEQMVRTIERYRATVDDPRYYCHGSTYFNGRFEDYLDDKYPEPPKPVPVAEKPFREPVYFGEEPKKADEEEPKTGGRGLEHLAELGFGEDLERMMKHLRGDKGGG